MRVSVIGGSSVGPETAAVAEALGERLAERGHVVVCGGLGGVMEAVCRGARTAGGETIGILPTDDRADANRHVTTPIATGMGHARNALVVMNGDAAVAVDGAGGTLSEIGLALAQGRPVAGLDTHAVDGVEAVDSPAAAVEYVERAARTD
ncbi:TIGR00725 family protein [Halorubrum sp. Atlit-8R]|uniref:TIGR00725 family protein n=1 Tax=unclassified Halorubrum TaxID=2642239 RepID=UPI000EF1ECB3|nr:MULTISPECIES: TIGR00725 family protein [unclassified Halorubrum]RLM70952.1 TIGR00725 family protein [Halorubrum sp. Atlit-9R]RLM71820.1 TIGR00725 family protein [Halorubrum sp. Atlit-9R]RLM82895.1 TIGR00725 family protein [Halorubrum sp. Atlit-8R]